MKIKDIKLKEQGDFIVLTADCTLRLFGSDVVYFKFDKKYKDFIAADASPFAAALLVPSMKLGQDLVIEGAISEQLYRGMHEIMKIMLSWNIGLKPISISVTELKKDNYQPIENASFFSGGVDAFYTYLRHKESGEQKIKYFILANGYDIALGNKKLWDMARETVEGIARVEGIEVITVESNARSLIEPIVPWDYTHGGCLAALGLSLRKTMKNIFIGSTLTHDQLFPWGSHPSLDYLWSTETVSFHHDGADTLRIEKIKFISRDSLVLDNLRVCYLNKKDKFNCGVCEKCLRTMISLRIAGALEASKTFPHVIPLNIVKKIKMNPKHGGLFHQENLSELERLNIEYPLQEILRENLKVISSSESRLREILVELWFLDYYYNRSRLYIFADFFRKRLAQIELFTTVRLTFNQSDARNH